VFCFLCVQKYITCRFFEENMPAHYAKPMLVDGLSIGVNCPPKQITRVRSLAPYASQKVYNVADFKECPKSWPRALGPKEASFFIGVTSDHEMWFDFNALSRHTHFAAVVVTVQRMNAVTGQKADHVYLEKYVGICPKHKISFEADRFCSECGYKWPAQNYITNAAPGIDGGFWLDGWRSQDGEIRQFVFADVEAGLGVAQQLIGDERTEDIRFAIFLSKNPKPISPRLNVLRRNISGSTVAAHQSQQYGTLGGRDLESSPNGIGSPVGVMHQIGTPTKQEVSFGRAVDQKIHTDPNDIDFWQPEPAAVIMLTPAPQDWVATVTRNGATIDRTQGGMGPLAGLKGVG
jgi:hypothetical protein